MISLRFAVVVVWALLIPRMATAGAWTQPPGALYGRFTFAGINSRQRFDENGDRTGLEGPNMPSRGTEYRGRELRLYAEYGVRRGWTAYGSFTVKQVRITEPLLVVPGRVLPETTHQTDGPGDLFLGARVRVRNGPEPVSLSAEAKIPSGYSTNANPSLGTGHADVTLRGLVGASAGWIYTTADAGWMYRGGPYQNAALFSFEVGGRALHYYTWRGVVRGLQSVGSPSTMSSAALFDPALASPRSITVEAVLGDEVQPGLDVEAGISHVLSGSNALAGNTFEAGLAFSIRLGGRAPRGVPVDTPP